MSCGPCKASRFGCGGQGCGGHAPVVRTSGILDGLTVKAADTAGARLAKELAMFAILTSPAWLALIILPKPQR
jgi:hypothetical protein